MKKLSILVLLTAVTLILPATAFGALIQFGVGGPIFGPGIGFINVPFTDSVALNVVLPNATITGTFGETIIPGVGAILTVTDFLITNTSAAAITDSIFIASDTFPILPALPGFVGVSGSFLAGSAGPDAIQGTIFFNQPIGLFDPFLTAAVAVGAHGVNVPFGAFAVGIVPAGTFQLGGILTFTLAAGASIFMPGSYNVSDNIAADGQLPEPGSIILLGSGLLAAGFIGRRKLKAS